MERERAGRSIDDSRTDIQTSVRPKKYQVAGAHETFSILVVTSQTSFILLKKKSTNGRAKRAVT